MIALVALAVGCRGGATGQGSTDTTTPAEIATIEEIAEALGCSRTEDLNPHSVGPIAAGAATRGLSCDIGEGGLHLFERAPAGDPEALGSERGGTVQHILERLDAGSRTDACDAHALVGSTYFVVGNDPSLVDEVGDVAGGVERPREPAAPMTSYLVTPCTVGVDYDGFDRTSP